MGKGKQTHAWLPLEVIKDNRLTKRHIKVLIALYSHLNHKITDTVHPSRLKLSKCCGMPMTRVSEVTSQLVDLGWLIKTGKGGFSKSTRYQLTVPDLVTVTKTVTPTVTKMVTGMRVTKTVTGKELSKNYPLELKGGNKRFKPPTVDEVRMYCNERNNSIDAETFVSFYQSKGWYVGKSKMKCWKSSMITWEKRSKNKKPKQQTPVDRATMVAQGIDPDTMLPFNQSPDQQQWGMLN